MKLGKLAAKQDDKRLKLGKYIATLPPAPSVCDWLSGITSWGMMLNDNLGDCTCAGIGHFNQVGTAATGSVDTPTDQEILDLYCKSCGYVVGDPSTDNGGVEVDVLNYVRKNGLGGRKVVVAYADPEPGNTDHIKQSIYRFSGVYIGLQLPVTAQNQDIWDVVGHTTDPDSQPGSWGGHAVFVPYYDEAGLVCITWGAPKRMTWNFWNTYCDEAHTLLSQRWLDSAPSDFALGDLLSDLQIVTG